MRGHDKVIASTERLIMNLNNGVRPQELLSRGHPRAGDRPSDQLSNHYSRSGRETVSSQRMADVYEALNSAEATLRPWAGSYGHLWDGTRGDVEAFILAIHEVQFVLEVCGVAENGAMLQERAVALLKIAMARLEEEFRYKLTKESEPLKASELKGLRDATSTNNGWESDEVGQSEQILNRIQLMPESVIRDLRELVSVMEKTGIGEVADEIYIKVRKAVLDETLYQSKLHPLQPEEVAQIHWEELEVRIDAWLSCIVQAIRCVFASERHLCNHVFADYPQRAEVCFREVAADGLGIMFGFSESVATSKQSPEKLFRVLEMYEALRDLALPFEIVFSGDGCAKLREECKLSMNRLAEAARGIFMVFENRIEHDFSKTSVPGGGIHGITRYVVNYLILLYDYRTTLTQLFLGTGSPNMSLPRLIPEGDDDTGEDSEEDFYDNDPEQTLELRALAETNAWKLKVLQQNLEAKAKLYRDPALGSLFLMNNIHYIASKVKSSELRGLLGDEWIHQQAMLVRQHGNHYMRLAWTKILNLIREDGSSNPTSRDGIKRLFLQFNEMFEELNKVHGQWAVPEQPLREELRAAINERLLTLYRHFHSKYAPELQKGRHPGKYLKYGPGEVEAMIQELFKGPKALPSASKSSG
eukprot:TRINITY_DN32476_c0_g1_i1.p1 TRINITY_DN32476_c0_g1~~TRINITY_DN32476_c0_g1_i1.p1  ORF type:complete len:643 (+),score=107.57 TRINITY_DN32476_c0_g1_i1:818-2746(+)